MKVRHSKAQDKKKLSHVLVTSWGCDATVQDLDAWVTWDDYGPQFPKRPKPQTKPLNP